MADFRKVLQNTINSFIENNTLAVKKKDTSLFSAILTEDCIRIYRPLSFIQRYPQVFKTEITNADYEAQMKMELQTMQDVSQKVTRTVIDTVERKATLWTEQTVFTVNGSKNVVEVIWDLNFSEDGTRVSQIMEFVDTYESTKVLEQMLAQAGAK
ncbi:hypothetical protein F4821DRAFT_251121 [Hypoxylon rubiginosum]|uniref:Uncharacterized protein n=1 Tax=Hypoxylon rubiginosum TaxID=110542 RepID=A0ACC0CJR2_9PEZI|nr:hypothetical protein F4821DRAFT_251121 [Hypoxylon rubiginosum]